VSFPNNDKFWLDTVQFVEYRLQSVDRLLAPAEFREKIARTFDYSFSRADNTNDFQWVIVHKGRFNEINSSFLEQIAENFLPVFANEVFVVFSSDRSLKKINNNSAHLKAFWKKIEYRNKSSIFNGINKNFQDLPIFQTIRHKYQDFKHLNSTIERKKNQYGAYLGNYRYLATTLYGNKIFLDTRDLTLTPHIIIDGVWEAWISERVISCLQPGMRAVEVGSNVGWYTLLIARQIGSKGKLIAFEANKDLVKLTLDSICINGYAEQVMLHNIAVSDHNGEAKFYIRERHIGNSSFGRPTQDLLDSLDDSAREITVPTVTLDEFLTGEDRQIDFMKIDAEGSEPLVFRGMKQLLEENQRIRIVIEYSPHQMRGAGFDPAREMLFLFELGFKAFKIEANGSLTQVNLETLNRIDHCELLLNRY
jgi:FkbM family methyltransferase